MKQFHDKVLKEIRLIWESGQVIISISSEKIICTNVTKLVIPRHFDWGISNQINEFISDEQGLKIEMQSGDIIEIFCSFSEK